MLETSDDKLVNFFIEGDYEDYEEILLYLDDRRFLCTTVKFKQR